MGFVIVGEDKMIEADERTQSNIEIMDGLKESNRVRAVQVGEEAGKGKGK